MAKLLEKNNINFTYSKSFNTIVRHGRRYGQPNHREVDFWLEEPIFAFGYKEPIQAIEVKSGHLDKGCRQQKAELRESGVETFIATEAHIAYWERHGLL